MIRRLAAFLRILALLGLSTAPLRLPGSPADLFDPGRSVPVFGIEVSAEAGISLRESPRTRVDAVLRVDSGAPIAVRIRIKGSVGSFRPFDDRPSLTVDAADPAQAGFGRLHLNNAAEDPSRLREWLGSRIASAVGVPSPRVAHAVVRIGDRDLGIYALVEGGTESWLRTTFPGSGGTLFEPPTRAADPTEFRPVQSSSDDRRLRPPEAFLSALEARGPEPWTALAPHVDEASFLDFLAMEVLTGHPDGYAFARNNYRLWVPADGRGIRWIPHGSDRLFTAPDLPWPPRFSGTAAKALTESRVGLERLRERVADRIGRVADAASPATLSAVRERLSHRFVGGERVRWTEACSELEGQVSARLERVRRQVAERKPRNLAPGDGIPIREWTADPSVDGVELAAIRDAEGSARLMIRAHSTALTGWTWSGSLPPGRYRFSAAARLEAFQALSFGKEGGLYLEAEPGPGARAWIRRVSRRDEELAVEFVVRGGTDPVRLRAGFRGASGQAQFDLGAFRLRRLE